MKTEKQKQNGLNISIIFFCFMEQFHFAPWQVTGGYDRGKPEYLGPLIKNVNHFGTSTGPSFIMVSIKS